MWCSYSQFSPFIGVLSFFLFILLFVETDMTNLEDKVAQEKLRAAISKAPNLHRTLIRYMTWLGNLEKHFGVVADDENAYIQLFSSKEMLLVSHYCTQKLPHYTKPTTDTTQKKK